MTLREERAKINGTGKKLVCPASEECNHTFVKKSVLDEHIRLNHPDYKGEQNEMQKS